MRTNLAEATATANTHPTLADILQADNVMDLLQDNDITRIGSRCVEEFGYDLASREEWEQGYRRWMDVAMQVRKAKTFPWAGAANIKFPLLTTSCIQFQARAYPVIVDGSNLVKGRVLGDDSGVPERGPDGETVMQPPVAADEQPQPAWEVPPGAKRARADRIGDHMTWQLLYDMPGWEEDTDRLLLMLPIVGCVIRKTYFDAIEKQNVSEMIPATDFVINYWAKSLLSAPRFTHILRLHPYQVEERIRSGVWRDHMIPTVDDKKDQSDTAPVEYLEQHCRIDLDGDGYPEPYVVTMTRENGVVVRIVACFDAAGVKASEVQHDTGTANVVMRIERKQYFTKYGFIPSPDGSFYDTGFGKLLDDITAAIDTIVNQSLDAATLQNAQGGFIGSGLDMKSGSLKFVLGEWKRVNVTGGTLRENLVPLNLPGPSAVLITLLEMLIGAAKDITSSSDALTGNSTSTEQPTTLLARIEQAGKVMTGIFKRIHRSFGQELRLLFALNRDFLDEEQYYALTDTPGKIGRADYQDKDLDVVPVSDPTTANDAQKAAKAQVLMEWRGNPLVNQEEIPRRVFEATGQRDIEKLLQVPPPQPDPKLLLDTMKQHNERDKTLATIRQDEAAAANQLAAAAKALTEINMPMAAAVLVGAAVKLGIDAAKEGLDDGQPADGPGTVPGMAGSPADAGLPSISDGQAGAADGSVGAGPTTGPDAAANGDGAGATTGA